MKSFLRLTTAAAALLGAVVFTGGASAAEWGVGVGVGRGIGFDVHTGGYCDHWGCPDRYWADPVYYGPVFYDGAWFRGPVYTRVVDGEHLYWIHGGWHRDEWRGAQPHWARTYHYGPALGLDYYREHGFRVSDRDWHDWKDRDRTRAWHAGYTQDRNNNGYDRYRDDRNMYRDHNGYRDRDQYQHTGYQGRDSYDHDRNRGYQNDRGYDRNAYHSDEQGPPLKTGFEQRRFGHPHTPPVTSQQNAKGHSRHSTDRNPDRQDQNGPTR
jgi:hypothetical protein